MSKYQILKVSIRDVSDPECDKEYYAPADEVEKKFPAIGDIITHPDFGHIEWSIEFERVLITCSDLDWLENAC